MGITPKPDAVIDFIWPKFPSVIKSKFGDITSCEVSYEDPEAEAEVRVRIGKTTFISCCADRTAGLMTLRGESTPQGMTDEEVEELGFDIAHKVNARCNSYEGRLVVYRATSFAEMEEEAARQYVFNEVMAFIQNIYLVRNKLEGDPSAQSDAIAGELGAAAEGDPFGYNDLVSGSHEAMSDGEVDKGETVLPAPSVPPMANEDPLFLQTAPTPTIAVDEEEIRVALDQPTITNKELQAMLEEFDRQAPPPESPQRYEPSLDAMLAKKEEEMIAQSGLPEVLPAGWEYANIGNGDDQFGYLTQMQKSRREAANMFTQIQNMFYGLYAPIMGQMRNVYQEYDQIHAERQRLNLAEASLNEQRANLSGREQEVLAKEQRLAQEQSAFDKKRDALRSTLIDYQVKCGENDALRQKLSQTGTELGAAQRENTILRAQIQALQAREVTVIDSSHDEDLRKAYRDLEEYADTLKQRDENHVSLIGLLRKEVAGLKDQNTEYRALIERLKGSNSMSQEAAAQIKDAQNRIAELEVALAGEQRKVAESVSSLRAAEERAETAEAAKDALHDSLETAQSQVTDLKEQVRQTEQQLSLATSVTDEKKVAQQFIEIFDALGVSLVPVAAPQTIFSGEYQGSQIVVNVDERMLHVTKPVKKPQRYASRLNGLNKQDIRTLYLCGNNEILCRSTCTDMEKVGAQISTIMMEMQYLV